MQEHLKLLGHKVHCPVSDLTGVVTSVSFDLSGCIQACVRQPAREGKIGESYWLDVKQLVIQSHQPIQSPPDFSRIPAGTEQGAQAKPGMTSNPAK